jgi:hypothetical protein
MKVLKGTSLILTLGLIVTSVLAYSRYKPVIHDDTESSGASRFAVPQESKPRATGEEIRQCTVDLNNQTVLYAQVPLIALQQAVRPSLNEVNMLHYQNYLKYSVSFKTFWKLSGLETLAPLKLPTCCEGCGGGGCLPNVEFTKTPGTSTASFKWSSCDGKPITGKGGSTQLSVEYAIPRALEGEAVIFGDSVHLFFTTEKSPRLKLIDGSTSSVLYDNETRCIGSSPIWGAVRPFGETEKVPHLPIFLETLP